MPWDTARTAKFLQRAAALLNLDRFYQLPCAYGCTDIIYIYIYVLVAYIYIYVCVIVDVVCIGRHCKSGRLSSAFNLRREIDSLTSLTT